MYSAIVFIIGCTICSIFKNINIDPVNDSLIIACIFLFAIALNADLKSSNRLEKYSKYIMRGYCIRVLLLFFDRYGQNIYHLPNSGADSEAFYYSARAMAYGSSIQNSNGFVILFGFIFSIIGSNRLFAQFIVLLFSLVAICVTAYTIDEIDICDEKKTKAISILTLLPNFAILSSIFLRESIVTMMISLSFYFYMHYYYRRTVINILFSIALIITTMWIHSGAIGIIFGYIISLLISKTSDNENGVTIKNIIIAGVIGSVVAILYIKFGSILFTKFLGLEQISDIANVHTNGGSSYAEYVGNSESVMNMIVFTIPRIAYFLFSPFPWQWRGASDIIAFFFGGLYYFYVVYLVIKALLSRDGQQKNLVVSIMAIALCATIIFAWGVSNVGTAARHRDKLITIYTVLYALCINAEDKIAITIGDEEILKI